MNKRDNIKFFDDNKIMIDFDSVLAFYTRHQDSKTSIPEYYGRVNLVVIVGGKIGAPSEMVFNYSGIESQSLETKYGIGKQIHDELLKYYGQEN